MFFSCASCRPRASVNPETQRILELERSRLGFLPQTLPVDVCHRDESVPVGLIDLVDCADVGVVQGSPRLSLVDKARSFVGGAERLGGEEFEGNDTFELGV